MYFTTNLVWGIEFLSGTSGTEVFCGVTAPEGDGWEQDHDTLDTWFSSGLWPFSTLAGQMETSDLKTYHPTTVLETGYDILFFWVARMVSHGISISVKYRLKMCTSTDLFVMKRKEDVEVTWEHHRPTRYD